MFLITAVISYTGFLQSWLIPEHLNTRRAQRGARYHRAGSCVPGVDRQQQQQDVNADSDMEEEVVIFDQDQGHSSLKQNSAHACQCG